ncbi:SseB family protein [Streptomyces auratus]|uniref:SseB family protein n=1 Tax=Streptomyces auratus AGR0001 TaxID=1160718 RepID=J2K6Z5_9ACTN|nr:SseB family protein [Streptomyces auratus]QTZ94976.1 SseB family protein [Streptomyces auratus AGR0001]
MSNSSPDEHAPPTEASSAEEAPSAEEAAETQAALIDIATSVALLPQTPPAEGEEERPEGTIALPVIEQEGNRYVPVFTTEDALLAAGGDPDAALCLPVVELAANWPADDLWMAVNPSTEEGLVLPADLVRALPAFSRGNGQAEEPGPEPG